MYVALAGDSVQQEHYNDVDLLVNKSELDWHMHTIQSRSIEMDHPSADSLRVALTRTRRANKVYPW